MRDLDRELIGLMTGLSAADWDDADELHSVESQLTDPGTQLQMSPSELHLLPAALAAVRQALLAIEARESA
jgi:hypothetical protein